MDDTCASLVVHNENGPYGYDRWVAYAPQRDDAPVFQHERSQRLHHDAIHNFPYAAAFLASLANVQRQYLRRAGLSPDVPPTIRMLKVPQHVHVKPVDPSPESIEFDKTFPILALLGVPAEMRALLCDTFPRFSNDLLEDEPEQSSDEEEEESEQDEDDGMGVNADDDDDDAMEQVEEPLKLPCASEKIERLPFGPVIDPIDVMAYEQRLVQVLDIIAERSGSRLISVYELLITAELDETFSLTMLIDVHFSPTAIIEEEKQTQARLRLAARGTGVRAGEWQKVPDPSDPKKAIYVASCEPTRDYEELADGLDEYGDPIVGNIPEDEWMEMLERRVRDLALKSPEEKDAEKQRTFAAKAEVMIDRAAQAREARASALGPAAQRSEEARKGKRVMPDEFDDDVDGGDDDEDSVEQRGRVRKRVRRSRLE